MHEMSIAMSLLETAELHALKNGALQINEIEVEVGALAGVMVESLEFCFESASKGTLAEGAKLTITSIPGMGECMSCNARFPVEAEYDSCPICDEVLIRVVQGHELKVKAINID